MSISYPSFFIVILLFFNFFSDFIYYDYSYLANELYKQPVIIYEYPKELKPFYARLRDDGRTVTAFDIIVPKVMPGASEDKILVLQL